MQANIKGTNYQQVEDLLHEPVKMDPTINKSLLVKLDRLHILAARGQVCSEGATMTTYVEPQRAVGGDVVGPMWQTACPELPANRPPS